MIWRIFLQLLGYDRDGWKAPLRDQRQTYAQFVADLCLLPEQDGGEEQQPAQQPGQYQREGKEEEKESAAGALITADCTSVDPEPLTPKTRKKLLVPSSCPPFSAISSLDLDASASSPLSPNQRHPLPPPRTTAGAAAPAPASAGVTASGPR